MKVLVISPHPDDETLGCGGAIAEFTRRGAEVYVLCVSCHNLNTGTAGGAAIPNREVEFKEACGVLGVTDADVLLFPDFRGDLTDQTSRIVYAIETEHRLSVDAVDPDLVLVPLFSSIHQDHKTVHTAAIAACRLRDRAGKKPLSILGYSGPDDLGVPHGEPMTVFVDISESVEVKRQALRVYQNQLKAFPHPRSLEAIDQIDRMHGLANGVTYAEVFTPYRMAIFASQDLHLCAVPLSHRLGSRQEVAAQSDSSAS